LSETRQVGWKRWAEVGLGIIAIILSILVFVHPGMTVVTIFYILGIILIIVGLEKIISGIFEGGKSRWGTVGLGVLALIFGIIVMAFPVSTAVFAIIFVGFGLLFVGISHVVSGIGDKQNHGWARGFKVGAGALAIALSLLVLSSPAFGGTLVISFIIGVALLILGIEIIAVAVKGSRIRMIPKGDFGR
jgi:uncharacterized membrane protein HdeD (DUF308 family)